MLFLGEKSTIGHISPVLLDIFSPVLLSEDCSLITGGCLFRRYPVNCEKPPTEAEADDEGWETESGYNSWTKD